MCPLLAFELKKILLDEFDLLGDIPKGFRAPRVEFTKGVLQFVLQRASSLFPISFNQLGVLRVPSPKLLISDRSVLLGLMAIITISCKIKHHR
jgi:hypothetical protein